MFNPGYGPSIFLIHFLYNGITSAMLIYYSKIPEDIMYDDLSDQLATLGTKMVSNTCSKIV